MKIALIGYGKMGQAIEEIAQERGHTIVAKIDVNNQESFNSKDFKSADVAIEFTNPSSAYNNYIQCFNAGLPVVSGTTGWTDRKPEIEKLCEEKGYSFFYASNFSIGVNLFFELNEKLVKMMAPYNEYEVSIDETHHIHKLDAPSGTAITLANGIIENHPSKVGWILNKKETDKITINAHREGEVAGIHEVSYDSEIDTIHIIHEAKSRKGFALGAVLAAEFIKGKKGVFSMKDLINNKG